jgi:tRNA1Val (adenine37-N6)-methyltransferase
MRNRAPAGKNAAEAAPEKTVERVGDLIIAQPARGYRYGLDPFLLAAFVRPRLRESVVDLGTGCGVIALLLARRWKTLKVWGVELQPELFHLAEENIRRNGLERRCSIIHGDARDTADLLPAGRFRRVVANPPFRPAGAGRVCPEPQRALARQEIAFSLDDLAGTAASLLDHGGILDFIHLPERLPEIFRALGERRLEPKRLRLVHSFGDSAPELALISARKGGRPGLSTEPPLIVFRRQGEYTPEVKAAFRTSISS